MKCRLQRNQYLQTLVRANCIMWGLLNAWGTDVTKRYIASTSNSRVLPTQLVFCFTSRVKTRDLPQNWIRKKEISNWKVSAPHKAAKNMAKNIKEWLSFDPWSNSFFRLGKPNLKSASVLNWKIVLSQEICHWPRRFHWNSLFMLLLLSNVRMIPRTWLGCYSGCIVSVMRCRTVMRDYPLPAQPNPQQTQGHIEEQGWNILLL